MPTRQTGLATMGEVPRQSQTASSSGVCDLLRKFTGLSSRPCLTSHVLQPRNGEPKRRSGCGGFGAAQGRSHDAAYRPTSVDDNAAKQKLEHLV